MRSTWRATVTRSGEVADSVRECVRVSFALAGAGKKAREVNESRTYAFSFE